MARQDDSPLEHLLFRFWSRRLLIHHRRQSLATNVALQPGQDQEIEWISLAKALHETDPDLGWLPDDVLLPGLMGVVNKGNDPRRVIRRIPALELDEVPEALREKFVIVERQPSGRNPTVGKKEKSVRYVEIPVDLMHCARSLYTEYPAWERAYFWQLAGPELPRLEQLRLAISGLMNQISIYAPSLEEHAAYFPAEDAAVLEGLSDQQWCERYTVSMQPIIDMETPTSLSLLAALATESFIVDNEMLLHIHREGFWRAMQQIISDPCMADIRTDFETMVMARILLGSWSLPAAFHVSSIKAPFVYMDEWKKITGIDQLGSICESR